jgi:ketosteroid isomerase-like protein
VDRDALRAWVDAYERAWRAPGVDGLDALFTQDATYATAPFEPPFRGLAAIRRMWAAERDPGEEFTMTAQIVALEGDTGVVRIEVRYTRPREQRYLDLWIVRLAPDGRCRAFEEWPFWPPGSGGGFAAGPAGGDPAGR